MKSPEHDADSPGTKSYSTVDLTVLEGLDQHRGHDSHRMETWEQARARIEALPEPQRTQRLEALEALERAAHSQS